MGIFQQFPYSNFHEMNLDQIIKIMREMQDEWEATKAEWASYKEFIDNYFDTLDVSEEVLRALRIMADDGRLNQIIDPVIVADVTAWLDEHITPTTPALDTSLSIAGAAADAKAAGDAIKVNKRNINHISVFDPDNANYGWLYGQANGVITRYEGANFAQTAPIKVYPHEKIIIWNVTHSAGVYTIVSLNSNDIEDTNKPFGAHPVAVDSDSYFIFEVPESVYYISIPFISSYVDKITIEISNRDKVADIQEYLDNTFLESHNLFDIDSSYTGFLYGKSNGSIVKYTDANLGMSNIFEVEPGDVLYIYGTTPNMDGAFISLMTDPDSIEMENVYDAVYLHPLFVLNNYSLMKFIVPDNCHYISMGFSLTAAGGAYVNILKGEKAGNNKYKIINALGDSLTAGYIASGVNANPKWTTTAALNIGASVNNYGVSGTSICDGSSESFYTRLNRMTENYIDCLVIWGGTNDYGDLRAATLGSITDTPAQGTNFYASFKNLILTAINKYPDAQIMVITPMRRQNNGTNANGISMEDIVNAEIEVARFYGVHCFDFYHTGGINPEIAAQRTKFTSDGLHANQKGIDTFIAPRFSEEIERVISCR